MTDAMDGGNFDRSEPQVTYPVRFLLREIRDDQQRGFATLTETLSGKADKADFKELVVRLEDHDRRLVHIEDGRREERTLIAAQRDATRRRFTRREKVVASVGSIALIIATVVGPLIAIAVSH